MARTGTVHHLRIDLSDVDRGVYEALDLRIAQHPSEPTRRVLAKTLAYALSYGPGIAFAKAGLSNMDEPEISISDAMGIAEWIEIGSPASDRLKRASNAARRVVVYSTSDADGVLERARALPRAARITLHALDAAFVDALAERAASGAGRFELVRSGGHLYATGGGVTIDAPLVTRSADGASAPDAGRSTPGKG
ncbi:MAG: YaeQ family protein [Polyangiaceae bacterium]